MRNALVLVALAAAACAQQTSRIGGGSGMNLPAQPIGANDLIEVSVYDAPEFSGTIRVSADGTFSIPMLKSRVLKADGLLPKDLETVIASALKEEQMLVEPLVSVRIAEYHSRPITVGGAVKAPVTFQADGPINLLQALARAGGLREDAGPDILVSYAASGASGKPIAPMQGISARGLIDFADPALNLMLTGGEEVRVPEAPKLFVVGNVKKQGPIRLQDTSEITIFQAISLVEGLAPYSNKVAYIWRADSAGAKQEIVVPLDKIMNRKAPDMTLLANDIFYIPDAKRRRLAWSVVEKVVSFGTTAGATALVYRGL